MNHFQNRPRICEQFRRTERICTKTFERLDGVIGKTEEKRYFSRSEPEIEKQFRRMQDLRRVNSAIITERTTAGVSIESGSARIEVGCFSLYTDTSTVVASIYFNNFQNNSPTGFLLSISGLIRLDRAIGNLLIKLKPVSSFTSVENGLEPRCYENLTGAFQTNLLIGTYTDLPDIHVSETEFEIAYYKLFYDVLRKYPGNKSSAMQHIALNLVHELLAEFRAMLDSATRHFEK